MMTTELDSQQFCIIFDNEAILQYGLRVSKASSDPEEELGLNVLPADFENSHVNAGGNVFPINTVDHELFKQYSESCRLREFSISISDLKCLSLRNLMKSGIYDLSFLWQKEVNNRDFSDNIASDFSHDSHLEDESKSSKHRIARKATSRSSSQKPPHKMSSNKNSRSVFNHGTFKIKKCVTKNTHSRETCSYYHDSTDKRRDPSIFKYKPSQCKNVEFSKPSKCPKGDSCGLSHSQIEIRYHPWFYKKYPCKIYLQKGKCPKGPICEDHHNQSPETSLVTAKSEENNQMKLSNPAAKPRSLSNSKEPSTTHVEQPVMKKTSEIPSVVTLEINYSSHHPSDDIDIGRLSDPYLESSITYNTPDNASSKNSIQWNDFVSPVKNQIKCNCAKTKSSCSVCRTEVPEKYKTDSFVIRCFNQIQKVKAFLKSGLDLEISQLFSKVRSKAIKGGGLYDYLARYKHCKLLDCVIHQLLSYKSVEMDVPLLEIKETIRLAQILHIEVINVIKTKRNFGLDIDGIAKETQNQDLVQIINHVRLALSKIGRTEFENKSVVEICKRILDRQKKNSTSSFSKLVKKSPKRKIFNNSQASKRPLEPSVSEFNSILNRPMNTVPEKHLQEPTASVPSYERPYSPTDELWLMNDDIFPSKVDKMHQVRHLSDTSLPHVDQMHRVNDTSLSQHRNLPSQCGNLPLPRPQDIRTRYNGPQAPIENNIKFICDEQNSYASMNSVTACDAKQHTGRENWLHEMERNKGQVEECSLTKESHPSSKNDPQDKERQDITGGKFVEAANKVLDEARAKLQKISSQLLQFEKAESHSTPYKTDDHYAKEQPSIWPLEAGSFQSNSTVRFDTSTDPYICQRSNRVEDSIDSGFSNPCGSSNNTFQSNENELQNNSGLEKLIALLPSTHESESQGSTKISSNHSHVPNDNVFTASSKEVFDNYDFKGLDIDKLIKESIPRTRDFTIHGVFEYFQEMFKYLHFDIDRKVLNYICRKVFNIHLNQDQKTASVVSDPTSNFCDDVSRRLHAITEINSESLKPLISEEDIIRGIEWEAEEENHKEAMDEHRRKIIDKYCSGSFKSDDNPPIICIEDSPNSKFSSRGFSGLNRNQSLQLSSKPVNTTSPIHSTKHTKHKFPEFYSLLSSPEYSPERIKDSPPRFSSNPVIISSPEYSLPQKRPTNIVTSKLRPSSPNYFKSHKRKRKSSVSKSETKKSKITSTAFEECVVIPSSSDDSCEEIL